MRWVLGPALPGPAFGAAGLLLADNSVLIVGGGDGRQVWHWAPGTDRFEPWPPLRTKRHGAALVADGEHGAWVIGGISETGEPSMRIEGVRPGGYVEAGMLTSPRPEPMAVVVDEMVVVLGLQAGVDAPELWDPSDDHHAVGRPAPEARTGASVIACRGKVLRAGGRAATSSPGAVLMPGTQLYDLQGDVWRPSGYLFTPRDRPKLLPWGEQDVIMVGGEADDPDVVALVEHFDGARWTRGCTMSVGRVDHAAAALVDGRILVVGGRTIGHLSPPFSELSSRP